MFKLIKKLLYNRAINKAIFGERMYFFGLILLAVSLPLSKFTISISQFIIAIGWLFSSRIWQRVRYFLKTPSAWMISGIYILFVLGMLYSTNFEHGLKELRIKLPLLILPFMIATAPPLSRRQWNFVMGFFVASVLGASFVSTYILATTDILDTRNISPYISHVRFGLMLSLAFFTCVFYAYKTMLWSLRFLMIILAAWIVIFLVLLEAVTGLGITVVLGIGMLIVMALKEGKPWVRFSFVGSLVVLLILGIFFTNRIISEELKAPQVDFSSLEDTTARGNPYYHDSSSTWHENGHYIYLYICEEEMKKEWNKRSDIPYGGKDHQDHQIKNTLIRFLNSKGMRKDGDAVQQLSEEEVAAIENGIANINYMRRSSFRARLSQIIYEYKNYRQQGNPGGHSVMQRLEYWKAAIGIIHDHPWIGVGTGDINDAFNEQYKKMSSQLEREFRLRAHNQYLRVGAALGLIGLALFLLFLLYPVFAAKAWEEGLFMVYFFIVLMSMLTEDTLETQVGATFFAFFFAFLLWGRRNIFMKN
ncbi:MAG: O-antigen ligase family protein [Bacteroidales bacterium]